MDFVYFNYLVFVLRNFCPIGDVRALIFYFIFMTSPNPCQLCSFREDDDFTDAFTNLFDLGDENDDDDYLFFLKKSSDNQWNFFDFFQQNPNLPCCESCNIGYSTIVLFQNFLGNPFFQRVTCFQETSREFPILFQFLGCESFRLLNLKPLFHLFCPFSYEFNNFQEFYDYSFYFSFSKELITFSISFLQSIRLEMARILRSQTDSFKNSFKGHWIPFKSRYFPSKSQSLFLHFSDFLILENDSHFLNTNYDILNLYFFFLGYLDYFETLFLDFSLFKNDRTYSLNILQSPQEYFRHAFSHIPI